MSPLDAVAAAGKVPPTAGQTDVAASSLLDVLLLYQHADAFVNSSSRYCFVARTVGLYTVLGSVSRDLCFFVHPIVCAVICLLLGLIWP